MKSLKILIAAALALTFVAQIARADAFDEISNENQEGKIIAAMRDHKESTIRDMQSTLAEMEKIQDLIGENEDSGGRLRALGEMIDLTAATIKDALKLDADLDENYAKLDAASEEIQSMGEQAREMSKAK